MKKYRELIRFVSLVFTVLGMAGCSSVHTIQPGEEVVVGRASFKGDPNANAMLFPEYRIAAGDVLDILYQVESWKEQPSFKIAVDHVVTVRYVNHSELDQTQAVRPDGMISLAFVGSVRVVGKTVDELTAELKEKYRDHLKDTDIYVVLEDFRGSIRELKADLKTAPRGLSRLVTVRPDGYATFVMVGDLYVAGRTVREVAVELNEKYKEILPGLTADVFLEQHSGSRIYVFGEVNTPGTYQILRPTSVFEAIAMAGSITSAARLDSVIVFRQRTDKVVATRIDLKKLLMPLKITDVKSEDGNGMNDVEQAYYQLSGEGGGGSPPAYTQSEGSMFYLHPDDIVFVSRRRLNSAAEIAREVSDILFFRGWGFSIGYDLDDERR